MKIAVFHNLPAGGAKRTVYEQVKYLSRRHEIHLFQLFGTDESFLSLTPFVSQVHTYPFSLSGSNRLYRDYQNFFSLALVHRRIAADINAAKFDAALIHADHFTQAPFVLRFLKIPSLYFCQEMLRIAYEKELAFSKSVSTPKKIYESFTRNIRKYIDRTNAVLATCLIVNSRYTRRQVRRHFKVWATVCYPGVDTKIFRPQSAKKNQILFIGQSAQINGWDLVKAIKANLKKLSLKVVDFSSKQRLSDEQLAAEYSASLVTLCISFNEPFGLVPLESMACGTPVLAVNEGGYKETVINAKTGWLLPRNPKKFAARLTQLIKCPELINKMGENGRKHVIENFTWAKHNSIVESALCHLASQ